MSEVTEIFNHNIGKLQRVKDMHIGVHTKQRPNGDIVPIKFVEFTVIGRTGRQYPDAIRYDEFKLTNPGIEVA
jgi:hypothetical protein